MRVRDMINILAKFCDNANTESGLLLVPMPTGFGKTYNVLQYIVENYDKIEGKIFFTTTLKKNLPYDQLRKMFIENGKSEKEFEEKVLLIDANVDSLINNFGNVESDIPQEYKNLDCYRRIKALIETINDCSGKIEKSAVAEDKIETFSSIAQTAKDEIREKHERNFRAYIAKKLKDLKLKKEDLLYKIKNDKAWQWIGRLYPAVFTSDRKVIFLSIDKFLLRNDTLIEPSYQFSGSIINKAIIFIDEFDATKDTVLTRIIEEGLKDKIDYLDLFKEIDAGLSNKEFTRGLLDNSEELNNALDEGKNRHTPEEIIEFLRKESIKIKEKFSLMFFHKIKSSDSDNINANCFMFHDFYFPTVLKDSDKEIKVFTDLLSATNWIRLISRAKSTEERNEIVDLLQSIKGFISLFTNGVKWIADNYYSIKTKEHGFLDYSYEFALKTVLSEFRIDGKSKEWMLHNCLVDNRGRETAEAKKEFDLSVYEKGFRYYHFLDSDEHDTMSKIQLVAFNNSPEKWILKLAAKAKVVGISATATLKSVTGNYDTGYLRKRLGRSYVDASENKADYDELRSKFDEFIDGYKKGKVSVKAVEIDSKILENEQLLAEIADSETLGVFRNDVKFARASDYDKNRYLKIFYILKQFHENQEMRSFLCMLNKLPKKGDDRLDRDLISKYIKYLNSRFPKDVTTEFRVLYGTNEVFSERKDAVLGELEKGKKIVVFSAYNTIGAGQNLQYKIPETEKPSIIKVNNYDYGHDDKDFDAIYVDKPTYVAVNIAEPAIEEKDVLKYLFQVEFLQENGEISVAEAWQKIRYAFSKLGGYSVENCNFKISDSKSIINHSIRIVLQAIGRICRTHNKKKEIFVFFDRELRELLALAKHKFESILLNPEFQALLDECENIKLEKENEEKEFVNRAVLNSRRSFNYIESLRKYEWTKAKIENWKKLREMVLKHPYLEMGMEDRVSGLYTELPTPKAGYCYIEESDYGKVAICFDLDVSKKHVSAQDARLSTLLTIPGLRKHFEENGYKVIDGDRFSNSRFMLTPPAFNNIYKGALGEVAGKYIFDNYVGIELSEMPDELFELFDYDAGNGVYIDFKHWGGSITERADDIKKKIIDKLEKCNGRRAIIINILSHSDHAHDIYVTAEYGDKIVEIPHLYDCTGECVDSKMILKVKEWIER
jgi:hypothetical protein